MSISLKGITWSHSRGFTSIVAVSQRFSELHPDVEITWEKRSLQEFADAPLETFLKENQNIRIIRLCLDNDGPGRVASSILKDKYESRGYKVMDLPPPKEYKDYNDWIKSLRSKKTITMEKYR